MKLKFLATAQSPSYYSFDGEVLTAHVGNQQESVDLSELEHGDKFGGIEPEVLILPGSQIIRDAYRDEQGDLHLALCQASWSGRWQESEWIDVDEYHPANIYIKKRVGGIYQELPRRMIKHNGEWVSPSEVDDEA